MRGGALPAWRLAVWLLAGGPLLWLAWRVVDGGLGPNPVEFLEHYSGDWALRLLLATLALTPLRRWSGRAELLRVRRLLGLWAFAWVCLHFSIYLTFLEPFVIGATCMWCITSAIIQTTIFAISTAPAKQYLSQGSSGKHKKRRRRKKSAAPKRRKRH